MPAPTGLRNFDDPLAGGHGTGLAKSLPPAGRSIAHSPAKINVAALGNMVPQLHIHVIARFEDDAAWPKPVWGVAPGSPIRLTP